MIELLIAVLACYRLAVLVTIDRGPLDVFKTWRLWLGKRAADSKGFHTLAELFNCPHCVGLWMAPVLALYLRPGGWVEFVVLALAIAGGQSALTEMLIEVER